MRRMTYEKWEASYKPVRHTRINDGWGGMIFDGYFGEKKLPKYQHLLDNEKHIWTLMVAPDTARGHIVPGFSRVNRVGIFLCKMPFENEAIAPVIALGKM